ncbi:MAG: RDD family protein [Bacteriovoracaceae bacterium]
MNIQEQNGDVGKPFDPKKIVFNFDEEETNDLDDFTFKPINDGLGFHHENKNLKKIVKAPQVQKLNTQTTQSTFSTRKVAIEEVPAPQMITPVKEEKKVEKKTIVLADPWERSLAFIVDMMILNIMIFAMGYFAFYFSGLDIRQLNFSSVYVLGSIAGTYTLIYTFFFSVLDISETPGKSIFNLKVVKRNEKPCSLLDTWVRSVISLMSLLLCALPLALGFHDKLSGTIVIRK